jgi:hypothetical protein
MISVLKKKKSSSSHHAPLLAFSLQSYKEQFLYYVREPILKYFERIWKDCSSKGKVNLETFRCYQTKLQEVKSGDSKAIYTEISASISPAVPLHEIMKLILVSECMLLGAVRPKKEESTKDLEISVPVIQDFLYQVILAMAQQLYGLPTLIAVLPGENEKYIVWKKEQLYKFVKMSFENTIRKYLPIADLVQKFARHFEAVSAPLVAKQVEPEPEPEPAKKTVKLEKEPEPEPEPEEADEEEEVEEVEE